MGRRRRADPDATAIVDATAILSHAPALDARAGEPPRGGAAALDRALPARVGDLEVRGELGRGGMGVVVEAWDPAIQRVVAVKLLPDDAPQRVARFVEEARIAGQLEHPSIVPVHALGFAEGRPWFAMRKVAGRTLRAVLGDVAKGAPGSWSRHRLLVAFQQVCRAIAYAHERGVVHRDLKPANVLLGDYGEVFVVDWGVAAAVGSVERSVVGTAGYIAPESISGGRIDGRADVFALGAILFEMLTLEAAFPGRSARDRLARTLEPAADARAVAPGRDLPDELAAACAAALATDPGARTASARALADQVEAFLEGSRRRAEAERLLADARASHATLEGLTAEERDLAARVAALEAQIPSWADLDAKAPLHGARDRLVALASERADRFEAVLSSCERALAQDPGHAPTRRFLADVYWARFEEAEREGDGAAADRHRRRVESWDDGRYRARLRGPARLILRVDPEGAEVWARRVDPRGLVWGLGPPSQLGRAPLDVALDPGGYVLEIRAPGREPAVYPVHLAREGRWEAEVVRLLGPGELAPGFRYVPAGPYVRGGDPEPQSSRARAEVHVPAYAIATFPVTLGEYAGFLSALHERDAEEAWARCPRLDAGLERSGERYFVRPGRGGAYVVPAGDDFGPWSPDFPVHSVTWEDAVVYAAWRGATDGFVYGLPTEDEWEKAARGVDGRTYPWGDVFDASLCKMNASRPGIPQMEAVGAFPTDISVYGARDLAGSMRAWCAEPSFDGDPDRRAVRGGSYATNARVSRCAVRYASPARHCLPYQGIRLVQRFSPPERG